MTTPTPDLPDGDELMRRHQETDYLFYAGAKPAMRVGEVRGELRAAPTPPLIELAFRPLFAVVAFWDVLLRGAK